MNTDQVAATAGGIQGEKIYYDIYPEVHHDFPRSIPPQGLNPSPPHLVAPIRNLFRYFSSTSAKKRQNYGHTVYVGEGGGVVDRIRINKWV